MVTEVPYSDGPESGGVSWSCIVQPASDSTAAAEAATEDAKRRYLMIHHRDARGRQGAHHYAGLVSEVAEIDRDVGGRADLAAGLVVAVERDLGDGRDDQRR